MKKLSDDEYAAIEAAFTMFPDCLYSREKFLDGTGLEHYAFYETQGEIMNEQ